MKTKERLIRVDGRASKSDVEVLKENNINISALIRDAISAAVKKIKKGVK